MASEILVLGATGHIGRPLVKALLARGQRVRAASRSGQPVEGAPGVRFDFLAPATWESAFAGVDRLYLVVPTGTVDVKALALPVVAYAAARKVKIVLQSALGVDADDSIPYRQIELAIERTGVPFVIVRPNWFADNFHIFWKPGLDRGKIAVPAGEGKSSFIDARDIAESAAAALSESRFDGQAFNLTGPQALSYAEAAAVLAKFLGRPVTYDAIDDNAFVALLVQAGLAEDYARFMASIFYPVRQGWTALVTDAVQTLTGHAPRDLETYVRDNLDRLKA